jgi:hypothetical protein
MPHNTVPTVRRNRPHVAWLEPLESRDVPSGLGTLFPSNPPLQQLIPVLPSLENSTSTTGLPPVAAVGLGGTLANSPGTIVDPVALAATGSAQTLVGLGSDVAGFDASVSGQLLSLAGTAAQAVLPVAANVAAVPTTHGAAAPAEPVPVEARTPPDTTAQTLLPLAALETAVIPVHGVAGRTASAPYEVQLTSGITEQMPPPVAVNVPAVTPAQRQAGVTRISSTTVDVLSDVFSDVTAVPIFHLEGSVSHDQPADAATPASDISAPVNRDTTLIVGGASEEETAETHGPVVSLDGLNGSGLLNALLPTPGSGTDEVEWSLEGLSGNAFSLWILGLQASVVALLVAVEIVRRKKQGEQPSYDLRPGWGAADAA